MPGPDDAIRELIDAFSQRDEDRIRATLSEDIAAYITNAEGGVDRVDGREPYVRRLLALQAPELSISVTQSVTVAPDQALAMVEIRAARKGRSLHNFAGFLARVDSGQITELWMVEALPAYSDEFWQ
jgi:ketosteroid isomerase-like protein